MVWFQCEDCGENLKKPKLPNHFRMCSAYKLSCIDCGHIFSQQTVQGHTQCISEAQKYGPKGDSNGSNIKAAKPNADGKKRPDVDINVGLSERPPWFCSLCNTNATSKQTLLAHADGKKHRAKARAFAAKQQPQVTEEAAPTSTVPAENNHVNGNSEAEKENSELSKKRKLDGSENDTGKETAGEVDNGEVIQVDGLEKEGKKKKAKHGSSKEDAGIDLASNEEDAKKKIKWKKVIKSALKSTPDGVLKMRKLRKLVVEALRESGFTEDESQISDALEQKVSSSSKFTVDGKYVRLQAKS